MLRNSNCLAILALTFALSGGVSAPKASAETTACRIETYLGQRFTACSFDSTKATIRVFHADPGGRPFGGFAALARELWLDRRVLSFAINGGMYHQDLSPVGLLVEHGKVLKAAVTGGGYGNFHLLPNGVFFVAGGRAGVMETEAYLTAGVEAEYATQSGPMLVIDGRLHPRFLADSDSLKIRNGVGVDGRGLVHFVQSEDPVRFHDFALLFRDRLACANALYLDGTISSLYATDIGRHDRRFPLGPIIGISQRLPD